MSKYNWNIYVIEEKLRQVEKLQKTQEFDNPSIIRNDIDFLKEYIEIYYSKQKSKDIPKLLDAYNDMKEDLIDISFLWNDLSEFNRITQNAIPHLSNLKTNSLSKDDILCLTHDFFKSLNKYFFDIFLKSYKNRKNHFSFYKSLENITYKGLSLCVLSMQENYIEISRDNTIEDVLTTIHEYTHVCGSLINPMHMLFPKNIFGEIDPLFMELISNDFLYKQLKDDNLKTHKVNNHFSYSNHAEEIIKKTKLIELERNLKNGFQTNKELKDIANTKLNIHPLILEDIIRDSNSTSDYYLISYLFAIEFYELYLKDKEKALFYLRKFILLECKSELEYYESIKKLGIIPNLSVMNFHKTCEEEAYRLSRKQLKKNIS